jgi:hypothetical protein
LFDLFHQQLCDLVDFVIDPKAKETGIAGASERQQYAVMTIKYIDRPTTYSGSTRQFRGALVKTGVLAQGNTLTSDDD